MGLVGSEFGHPSYHASKGAVRLFTKAMAVRHAGDGIRVNSVHPGFATTPMTAGEDGSDWRAAVTKLVPMGRFGLPEEIAHGIVYLASDESSFVTGSELVIDGCMTAQ